MNFKNVKVKNISSLAKKYELPAILFSLLGFNKLKNINSDLFISYSFPSNYLLRNNNFLFSNSIFTKKKLDKIYNVSTKVSYPPVDPIFKPSDERIKGKFVFASGRIIPEKKYDWLIEACGRMKTKVPLYISGQVNELYKLNLEKLAKDNHVDLKFLGKLSTEELVKYYSSASVFGFTIPLCDYGLVPIESISCGTPVVAWKDGGGQTELIKEGVSGLLAKPYDLNDFAKCMDEIIKSDMKVKKKKEIAEWAKKFSYDYIRDEFVKDVEKVAGKV